MFGILGKEEYRVNLKNYRFTAPQSIDEYTGIDVEVCNLGTNTQQQATIHGHIDINDMLKTLKQRHPEEWERLKKDIDNV